MSRNNAILVVEDRRFGKKRKYYVFQDVNADEDWILFASENINENTKRTNDRARALVLAHNIQRKMDTEYGVCELVLKRS